MDLEGRSVESGTNIWRFDLARRVPSRKRAFSCHREGASMANHLTPEELSKELGIDRQEVIRVCVEEGVPIYQGKIDKTLFQAQLEALGVLQKH
jgi:hypothetical protein